MGHLHQNKRITWVLIAALLNLVLIMVPGGMVWAAPSEHNRLASSAQMEVDASPCHSEMTAAADLEQSANNACADCGDHCPLCAQIGAGSIIQSLDLKHQRQFFTENISPRLTAVSQDLVLPPPRQSRC